MAKPALLRVLRGTAVAAISLLITIAPATAIGPCPYEPDRWTRIGTLKGLPTGVAGIFGEMADKGERFKASDALPAGPHPPFQRFVSGYARECVLLVQLERGGIGPSWHSAELRFEGARWAAPRIK